VASESTVEQSSFTQYERRYDHGRPANDVGDTVCLFGAHNASSVLIMWVILKATLQA
jgi:hypothetical protein